MSNPLGDDANQNRVDEDADIESIPEFQTLYQLLQSRKPCNLTLKHGLLCEYIGGDIDSLRETAAKRQLVMTKSLLIESKGTSAPTMGRNWQAGYVAQQLATTYIRGKQHRGQVDALPATASTRSNGRVTSDAKAFLDRIIDMFGVNVAQANEKKRLGALRTKPKAEEEERNATAKTGARPQDKLEFDISKAETEQCSATFQLYNQFTL